MLRHAGVRKSRSALLLLLASIALLAALYFGLKQRAERGAAQDAPRQVVSAQQKAQAAPATPPDSARDPVTERPAKLDPAREAEGDAWIGARPGFQASRTPAERGGVEPCATQPVDAAAFEPWTPLGAGRLSVPRELAAASDRFDLVIHLHGEEPVRRELIESGAKFVLYTRTLDTSQSYATVFDSATAYAALVSEIERAVSQRAGRPLAAGHVALSAWSAGFVGVEAALAREQSRDVDAVILIDGLHAPRGDRAAFVAQLAPFVGYAERAAAGQRFLFVSHSSIDPPDFASTTECAHYLIAALHGRPQPVRREDALGLELVELFSRGEFHVRGYAGNDKADHCAQLGVLRDAFSALARRWKPLK